MKKTVIILGAALALFSSVAQAQVELVKDINTTGSAFVETTSAYANTGFISNSKYVFFVANNGTDGKELFRTDGTAAGTIMLKNINPTGNSDPDGFSVFNDEVYFSADDGTSTGFYKTDGTAAGTVLLKAISIKIKNGGRGESVVFNNALYFGVSGELWKTDGTAAGTVLVKNLKSNGSVKDLVVFNNKIYLSGETASLEASLVESDGTEAGTKKVLDLDANIYDGVAELAVSNGKLFFQGSYKSTDNPELYVSDGTAAGTKLVKDLNGKTGGFEGSKPKFFTEVNGATLFRANDGLWKTDGTAAGTTRISTISIATFEYDPNPFVTDGKLLYTSGGGQFYISDGTAAGTNNATNQFLSVNPSYLTLVGSKVYFSGRDGSKGTELWVSDGTVAGTKVVAEVLAGSASSYIDNVHNFKGTLYFIATDGKSGYELYKFNPSVGAKDVVTLTDAIVVSPNPVSDVINIKIQNPNEEAMINLFDLTGKNIMQQKVQAEASMMLNATGLEKGIYIVEYRTSNGVQVEKIVKQ